MHLKERKLLHFIVVSSSYSYHYTSSPIFLLLNEQVNKRLNEQANERVNDKNETKWKEEKRKECDHLLSIILSTHPRVSFLFRTSHRNLRLSSACLNKIVRKKKKSESKFNYRLDTRHSPLSLTNEQTTEKPREISWRESNLTRTWDTSLTNELDKLPWWWWWWW